MMRGHKEWSERFINELSTRYVPFKHRMKGEKELQTSLYQLRVCPIQLYQISFPEEHRDAVLTTVFNGSNGEPGCPDTKKSYLGLAVKALRKMLKLDPIPDYKKDSWLPMDFPQHIEIIGLGLKEDAWVDSDGKETTKAKAGKNAWEAL